MNKNRTCDQCHRCQIFPKDNEGEESACCTVTDVWMWPPYTDAEECADFLERADVTFDDEQKTVTYRGDTYTMTKYIPVKGLHNCDFCEAIDLCLEQDFPGGMSRRLFNLCQHAARHFYNTDITKVSGSELPFFLTRKEIKQ